MLNHFDLLAFLVREGVVNPAQEDRVKDALRRTGSSLEQVVLELGLAQEDAVFAGCAKGLGVPHVTAETLPQWTVEEGALPEAFTRRASVVLARDSEGETHFVTPSLEHSELGQSIGFLLGRDVRGALVAPSVFPSLAGQIRIEQTDTVAASEGDIERLKAMANDGPVVKFASEMFNRAADAGASDIHIEATAEGARIRFRIGGDLQLDGTVQTTFRDALISRLKVVSNLNISEKRRPQDGRIDVMVRGRKIDIRLSTLPTQFGESVVLRLLDQTQVGLDWGALGFSDERCNQVRDILRQPNGIFLVAGPTGSGKTTTLYTALSELNDPKAKILTVEDPIEYSLEGINQVQVDPTVDLDFANVLRAMLRQDANVILVGEIRDRETAEIAVRAALIGRLVLSTIHTNDSPTTIDRLLDLGVEPYLIAATLRGVLSQRLIRDEAALGQRRLISQMMTMDDELREAVSMGERGRTLAKRVRSSEAFSTDEAFH